ncbi:MAG: VOC family protein [Acidimicrobiales bacterium]|nr:VOC family protein [Acidimicrobiales bacterium]
MEVLSSRVLIHPADVDGLVGFYRDVVGLRIYREFGAEGRVTGVVFFLGGGFLEIGRGSTALATPGPVTLWLQVPDVDAEVGRLAAAGVEVLEPPATRPWGLREGWVADPAGNRLVLVQVPDDHPLRRRV